MSSNAEAILHSQFSRDGWYIKYQQRPLDEVSSLSEAQLVPIPAHLGMDYQGRLMFRISANNPQKQIHEEMSCYQVSEHLCMVCIRAFRDLSAESLSVYPMLMSCLTLLPVEMIEKYTGSDYDFTPIEAISLDYFPLFEAPLPWLLARPHMPLEPDEAADSYEEDQESQYVKLSEDSLGNDISSGTSRTTWTPRQPKELPAELQHLLAGREYTEQFAVTGDPLWVRRREYTYEHLGVSILGEVIWQVIYDCELFELPEDERGLIRFELSLGDQIQKLSPPIYFVSPSEPQDQDGAQAFHASYTRGIPLASSELMVNVQRW